MANVDSPFGLRPLRYLNGSPWNGAATRYHVDSGYGTALYIGDPVMHTGTTDATGKYLNVQLATLADANYTLGPIVAVEPKPATSLERVYHPGSTDGYVWVADDPNLIFEIQVDSDGVIAIADFGLNAIMVQTHAGSTITGLSGIELDESSCTNNSSMMCLVLRLVDREDNELAQHAKVEVLLSAHVLGFTGSDFGRMGSLGG